MGCCNFWKDISLKCVDPHFKKTLCQLLPSWENKNSYQLENVANAFQFISESIPVRHGDVTLQYFEFLRIFLGVGCSPLLQFLFLFIVSAFFFSISLTFYSSLSQCLTLSFLLIHFLSYSLYFVYLCGWWNG